MQFWLKHLKKIIANLEKIERRAYVGQCLIWACILVTQTENKSRNCSFWLKSINSSIGRIALRITEWNYGKSHLVTWARQIRWIINSLNSEFLWNTHPGAEVKLVLDTIMKWGCHVCFPVPLSPLFSALL